MKICSVYQRKESLFIQPSCRTDQGVWIVRGEVATLQLGSSDLLLGERLLAALDESRTVPHPRSWKGLTDPLLAVAGVKSWKTFSRSSRLVSVEFGQSGKAVPYLNLGHVEGFEPLAENEVAVEDVSSASAWGRAARHALAHATIAGE